MTDLMESAPRIVLITPMKNESDNIHQLFHAIARQSCSIYAWIIVENGSTDNTADLLAGSPKPATVQNLFVLPFALKEDVYALGVKYSTVVNAGFKKYEEMVSVGQLREADYIGILDADCFPESNYFGDLSRRMALDSVDISSGVGVFTNGSPDGEAKDWVRGNCRLWSIKAFKEAGYVVGPSADTLSVAKATIRGFTCRPYQDLVYRCREMGAKTKYRYYGYSSYYRGIRLDYATLRMLKLLLQGKFRYATGYYLGYVQSMIKKVPRIDDEEIFRFFNVSPFRRLR